MITKNSSDIFPGKANFYPALVCIISDPLLRLARFSFWGRVPDALKSELMEMEGPITWIFINYSR
tara:strand:+ start:242 stop:436 length:195 start_codon:yes stop_codon:yes gene_type:complete